MTRLIVIDCGPATSIQDRGRFGVARLGLARAGAMDPVALRVANALVGNVPDTAAIEFAYAGGRFTVTGGSARVALAGAPARMAIDGRDYPHHTSLVLHDGQTLSVGRTEPGAYAMLAVEGGLAVAPVLGSRSLDARAGIGGLSGRALRAGDAVPLVRSFASRRGERGASPVDLEPTAPIRIVLGPQDGLFTRESLDLLLEGPFVVSHQLSRMACKLDGPQLKLRHQRDMVSEGTLPGSIQVPPDGVPLVLLADRQTIGGYPKIATVISSDLRRLAQRWPGDEVRFEVVTPERAAEIVCAQRAAHIGVVAVGGSSDLGEALLRVRDCTVNALEPEIWDPGLDSQLLQQREA